MDIVLTEIPSSWPILSLLQALPFLVGLLLTRWHGTKGFILALLVTSLEFALAIHLYLQFDAHQPAWTMQFVEQFTIWKAFQYHVGVDGLSVLFILITALISFLGVVFIVLRRLHSTSMLALIVLCESVLMSQFVTLDIFWFWLMTGWEILFTAYMTKRWATFHDVTPTLIRYLQFMGTAFALMGLGVLLMGWSYADTHQGQWSFDLADLIPLHFSTTLGTLIFFAWFYGLAIRIPAFPFHGWLADFMLYGNVTNAPMILLGVKVGVYALLRFVFPIVPEAVEQWQYAVVGFAFIGVFYAAILAIGQRTLREQLAFAVISHTGLVIIGLFTLKEEAFHGAVLLAINFGLAISALLLMTGLLWQRTRTTRLNKLGGLLDYLPMVGAAFLIAGLAIVGMPGTPGFDGVHFILAAAIQSFGAPVTIAAAMGNIMAAGFLLRAFQRTFLGSLPEQSLIQHWDTQPPLLAEKVLASTMIIAILGIGFYSLPWLILIESPLKGISELFPALQSAMEIKP
jgi:NADH-quinone oxidoreductase subunit M